MSDERFELLDETIFDNQKQAEDGGRVTYWVVEYQQRQELVDLLNELNDENNELKKENEQLQKETVFLAYWKRKAMILLMQVRRLTPRMTDEEVMEFSKELDDE